jgi:L-iditol 2-dehydrogenase
MYALLLTEYRKLELVAMDEPTLGPHDVLVRVAACGICGSDIHGYDGTSGRRIPPIVMGHEAAGVVAKVGDAVDRAKVGDRVTFDSTIYCGQCDACRRGQVNLCPSRRVLGVSCDDYRQQGAFAEFVAVPQHILYPLPPGLPFEHAALIEPVAIALHAVARLNVSQGERALVVGCGMIGLLAIQALRIAGCHEVTATDLDESRLQLAKQLGATGIFTPPLPQGEGRGEGASGGWGRAAGEPPGRGRCAPPRPLTDFDIAIEAVGNAAAFETAINSVHRGGRIGLVGNLAAKVTFPLQSVVTRELTLIASCASAGEYPRAIELLSSGQINLAPLISAVAPLAEGAQWFERLYAREPGLIKVILQP